jgi:hypothetical protein
MSEQKTWDDASAAGVWGVGWQQEEKAPPKRKRLKWTNTVTKQEGFGPEMEQEEFAAFVKAAKHSLNPATRDAVLKGHVKFELVEVDSDVE